MDHRIALAATMRNEGAFILEWVAHHKCVGFDEIIIASNDCDDGSDALLARLAKRGDITHIPHRPPKGKAANFAAYDLIYDHPAFAAADWAITLDSDEFLNVHDGDRTVQALVAAAERNKVDGVVLNWRCFGDNGVPLWDGRAVLESFTRAAPAFDPVNQGFKTLFRNDGAFTRIGAHRPRRPDPVLAPERSWVNACGEILPSEYLLDYHFARPARSELSFVWGQVNHYAVKTADHCFYKVIRGSGTHHKNRFGQHYWRKRNRNDEEETSILRWRGAIAAQMAEFLSDPVLRRRHAFCRWRMAQRLAPLAGDAKAAAQRRRTMRNAYFSSLLPWGRHAEGGEASIQMS